MKLHLSKEFLFSREHFFNTKKQMAGMVWSVDIYGVGTETASTVMEQWAEGYQYSSDNICELAQQQIVCTLICNYT